MENYLGQIQTFAFPFAPKGWMFCQGQLINVSQNAALFSLLGTTCGGNGQSNFGLPDLRGAAVVGTGQLPGGGIYAFGKKYGAETVTLAAANLVAHTHPFTSGGGQIQVNSGAAKIDVPISGNVLATATDSGINPISEYNTQTPNVALNTGGGASGGQIQNTGASQPVPIMQPYIVLNYCIALTGIYPSRG